MSIIPLHALPYRLFSPFLEGFIMRLPCLTDRGPLTRICSNSKLDMNISRNSMELKIRKNKEIYIIDIQGELDLYNSYKLKELLMKMLEKKIERYIINMEDVEYIDSSGIGALIYISSTLKKMNLKLAITNIHGSVKKVIELTKLMNYFPIVATLEEAIKKMGM
jgi:anti-sigma B factor antagonist